MSHTKDLLGKVAVVTGANTGIGKVTAETLAARGAHVILACRNAEKTAPVLERIAASGGSAEFSRLDLNDLTQVRASALELRATHPQIDLLINNAGLAGACGETAQGFELAFGTNALAPFLYTALLEDAVGASPTARIVNVASRAHDRKFSSIDWDAQKRPTASRTGLPEYGLSKLANVLHTREFNKRTKYKHIRTYSLHPGVVATDVWRHVWAPLRKVMTSMMITEEQGALTTLYCATSSQCANETGHYYDKSKLKQASKRALDDKLAAELWDRCLAWTADYR